MESLILFLLLAVLFVPLLLASRRQRRQLAQMQQLQSSLQVGDQVLTTSGLRGTIVATTDEHIDLEIAPGVVTTWVRQAVRERLVDEDESADDAETTETTESAQTAETADAPEQPARGQADQR